MHRSAALVLFAATTLIALPGFADSKASSEYAGKKGYVAAYDADGTTVLDVQSCDMKKSAHDYTECGKHLRDRVKEDLCKARGKGKYKWFYQVSDGKRSEHTAFCK
jgi:hypothetical protein